jgi:hypothetical protein
MAEKVTIGNCELWHGDCREVLPLLPKCDLILTDPPYGIGEDGGGSVTGKAAGIAFWKSWAGTRNGRRRGCLA